MEHGVSQEGKQGEVGSHRVCYRLQLCEGPDGGVEEGGLECFECQGQLRD